MAQSYNNIFHFKGFSLQQGRTAMRINTDGVLLAAWAGIDSLQRILDIGTGCGVIAAIIAQRLSAKQRLSSPVQISAIEPHRGSYEDAAENFSSLSSLWPAISLCSHNCTLQEWMELCTGGSTGGDLYDLIISNPPYFTNSLKSAHTIKNSVRHADSLPQGQLILAAERLLAPSGRLAIILPCNEAQEFMRKVSLINELHLSRLCAVRTTPSKPVRRYMMEFARGEARLGEQVEEESLVIQDVNGYTEEYRALTGGLYIA